MAAYLVCLRSAARSAAAPGVMDVRALWEAANVSGQVTSHVRHLPTFQGTSVIPSGRFPSDLKRPIGSLDEGTPDRTQARHNMSFNVLCRAQHVERHVVPSLCIILIYCVLFLYIVYYSYILELISQLNFIT